VDQEAILNGLRRVRNAYDAEDDRHRESMAEIGDRQDDLLKASLDAGIGVESVAEALGASRRTVKAALRRLSA
jgi:DNA-binding PucR family transcriptional regulator